MIVDLYKSGMNLSEISSEYGIAKSAINGWIKDIKKIKVDGNEILHQRRALTRKAMDIL